MPKLVLQRQALLRGLVERLREEMVASSLVFLGMIHRRIGSPYQGFNIGAIVRVKTDADAGARMQFIPVHQKSLVQGVQRLLRHDSRIADAGQQWQTQHVHIVAGTGDAIAFAQAFLQAGRDHLQQAIADLVPQRIIDVLEIIQADEEYRHLCAISMRKCDRLRESILQQLTIGQACQCVVVRHIADSLFGLLAFRDFG
ncbi:MAG: hypothetical protein ABI606_01515, partial [Rhodoferax sp.]